MFANAMAISKLAALAGVKAAYTQKQKEVDAIKHKFTVIDQLRANQNGPVQLLNTITQTVNSTDAVWLNKMSDDGKSIFESIFTALKNKIVAQAA